MQYATIQDISKLKFPRQPRQKASCIIKQGTYTDARASKPSMSTSKYDPTYSSMRCTWYVKIIIYWCGVANVSLVFTEQWLACTHHPVCVIERRRRINLTAAVYSNTLYWVIFADSWNIYALGLKGRRKSKQVHIWWCWQLLLREQRGETESQRLKSRMSDREEPPYYSKHVPYYGSSFATCDTFLFLRVIPFKCRRSICW